MRHLLEYVKTLPVLSVINRVLNKTRGNSTCQKKRDVIRRRAATQNGWRLQHRERERERGKEEGRWMRMF